MLTLITLAIAASVALSTMVAAHYLAPRLLGRTLHRLEAYCVGCLFGILLPFTGWCLFWLMVAVETLPVWLPPLALLAIMLGAGAGTGLAWAVDAWAGNRGEVKLQGRGHGQP